MMAIDGRQKLQAKKDELTEELRQLEEEEDVLVCKAVEFVKTYKYFHNDKDGLISHKVSLLYLHISP